MRGYTLKAKKCSVDLVPLVLSGTLGDEFLPPAAPLQVTPIACWSSLKVARQVFCGLPCFRLPEIPSTWPQFPVFSLVGVKLQTTVTNSRICIPRTKMIILILDGSTQDAADQDELTCASGNSQPCQHVPVVASRGIRTFPPLDTSPPDNSPHFILFYKKN